MEEELAEELIHTVYYNSPIGTILLEAEDEQLTVASFVMMFLLQKPEQQHLLFYVKSSNN